jgi:hypothetical protein
MSNLPAYSATPLTVVIIGQPVAVVSASQPVAVISDRPSFANTPPPRYDDTTPPYCVAVHMPGGNAANTIDAAAISNSTEQPPHYPKPPCRAQCYQFFAQIVAWFMQIFTLCSSGCKSLLTVIEKGLDFCCCSENCSIPIENAFFFCCCIKDCCCICLPVFAFIYNSYKCYIHNYNGVIERNRKSKFFALIIIGCMLSGMLFVVIISIRRNI